MGTRTEFGHWRRLLGLLVCVFAALTACGGGGGGGTAATDGPPSTPVGPDYAPLAVGDTWVYRRADGGLDRVKVTGTRVLDGRTALIVADTDLSTGEISTAAYVKNAAGLTEVPDGSDPFLSAIGALEVVRLPLRVGDSYTQVDRTISDGFDVDRDNRADPIAIRATVTVIAIESVTVPAGTFPDCVKVRTEITQSAVGSSTGQTVTTTAAAEEWYAANLGVVRSRYEFRGAGRNEVKTRELQAWRVGERTNDSVAPRVTSTRPAAGATVGRNGVVVLEFDEPIDREALAVGALSLLNANGATIGTVSGFVTGSRLEFNLPATLPSGTYTLVLGGSVQDLLGNRVAPQQWALTIDVTTPVLVSSVPAANSTRVALSSPIDLQFSEAMSLDSVRQTVVIQPVTGVDQVGYTATAVDERTVRLQPNLALQAETTYEVRMAGNLSDVAGNVIGPPASMTFRTGTGPFSPLPVAINGFVNVSPVAVGDVSGDGRADVVSLPPEPCNLLVRRQRADGTLDAGYTVPLRAIGACGARSIQIADLNGDGRNDVVLGLSGSGLLLLLQNASGILEVGPFLPSANSHVVRVADLNGDGRMDLVGIGSNTHVSIWLQRGDAVWGTATLVPLNHMGTMDMAVGDINGDGRPDIVVSSFGDGPPGKGLGLLLQRADGGFDAGGYLEVDPTWGALGVAVGDVNGDGRADIVSGFRGSGLAVFKQGPNGQLQAMQVLPGFNNARYFRFVDLNGDGLQDLVVQQQGLTPLVVTMQQRDGTLRWEQQVENQLYSADGPDSLAVGDLNGDGLVDIVMSGPLVLYATPRAPVAVGSALRSPRGRAAMKASAVR